MKGYQYYDSATFLGLLGCKHPRDPDGPLYLGGPVATEPKVRFRA